MGSVLNKGLPYILNGLIVIAIMLIILAITNTYPFGTNVLGKGVAISQIKPMLYNFIARIQNNNLLNYTFNNGLGVPILFNIVNCLASPLNLIALLFKNPNAMLLSVILLKTFLTAINVTIYSKSKTSSYTISLIASITYVFSSWFLAYYNNIMWLDIFMIFPLFQLGLEKLITKNKFYLFIFTLAYMLITNLTLSFDCLIYMLIYFIIRTYIYEKDNNKLKTTGIFLGSLLLVFLLSTFAFKIMIDTNQKIGETLPLEENLHYFVNVKSFFKSLFYGNYTYTAKLGEVTFPNLACNALCLVACLFTFLNKKISTKDKIFILIGFILILLNIFITKIDYLMNMFKDITNYSFRYSFIFSFLLTMLLIKNLKDYDLDDKKKVILITIIFIIIAVLLSKEMDKNIFIFTIISLILLIPMSILLKNNKLGKIIISLFVIFETIYIGRIVMPNPSEIKEVTGNFITEPIKYRLNSISDLDTFNDNLYTNQDVTYLHSSIFYYSNINLYQYLGCSSGPNVLACVHKSQLFDMLLNVQNEYYLEKIYSVNKDIELTLLNTNNLVLSQENIIKNMTGITDIFDVKTIKGEKEEDGTYHYQLDTDYYLIEDGQYKYFQTYTSFTAPDEQVTIYTLNQDKLKEIHNYLAKNQIEYTTYEDNHIVGNINVDKDQIIFTSIPYDKSWEVYLDDEKVETIEVLESLLGIEAKEGKHKIELKYKNKYLITNLISFITLILIIINFIYSRIRERKEC